MIEISSQLIYEAVISDFTFNATITHTDNISYKISMNDSVINDWSAFVPSPSNISQLIQYSNLTLEDNVLKIEVIDINSITATFTYTIKKKLIESTFVSSTKNNPYTINITVDNSNKIFLKIGSFNEADGYLKSVKIICNLINGNNNSGIIKIAPVKTSWTYDTLNPSSQPLIDTTKEQQYTITNSTGQIELDIKNISQLDNYGIVIYSLDFPIVIDSTSVSIVYDYVETILLQPQKVYSSKVLLSWNALKLKKLIMFGAYQIERSDSINFSSSIIIYETSDINTLSFEDTTLAPSKNYYYRLKVHLKQIANNGTINYNLTTQQDFSYNSSKAEFTEAGLQMKFYPMLVETEDMQTAIYNSEFLEYVDGKLQLRQVV